MTDNAFPRANANARFDLDNLPVPMPEHAPIGVGLLPNWFGGASPKAGPIARSRYSQPRAGVYGRISTTSQKESSIERQFVQGEDYAERIGCVVVERWVDNGVSGAYWHDRDGIEQVVMAARAGLFEVLVIEHIDRLGRDIGIIGTVYRELTDLGVQIHGTLKKRQLDHQDVAMLGLAAVEARLLLIQRTKDGKLKMLAEQRAPNGPCFGYDKVPGSPGRVTINETQAAVIREIFRLRVEGLTCRQISFSLNQRGMKTKLDKQWCGQTVARIVGSERYVGKLIWGRKRSKKRFSTGKIVVSPGDPSEIVQIEVPEWAIVDRETFDAAQVIPRTRPEGSEKPPRVIPKYLLSSKIKCHVCGKNYIIRGTVDGVPTLQCTSYNIKKLCRNGRIFRMDDIEAATLAIVREHLEDSELEREYAVAYEAKIVAHAERIKSDRSLLEGSRDTLVRQIRDTFDEKKNVGLTEVSLVMARQSFSADLDEIEEKLNAMPVVSRFARPAPERLRTLREAFDTSFASCPFRASDEAGFRLLAIFRALVTSVTIEPRPGRGHRLRVKSALKSLVQGTAALPDSAEGELYLVTPWRTVRNRGRLPFGMMEDMEAAANAGLGRLTDEQWEHVRPVVPSCVAEPRGGVTAHLTPPDTRSVVEATIYAFTTGAPWKMLPPCFGEPQATLAAMKRLIYCHGWEKIAEALKTHAPKILEGIAPGCTRGFRMKAPRNDRS